MRRNLLSLCLFLGIAILTLVVEAGEVESLASGTRNEASWQANKPEPIDLIQLAPISINSAADSCSNAGELTLPGGDITDVDVGFTADSSDPVLGCMWGYPSSPRGYRTAWYQFTAPSAGVVTLDTLNSTYDTVVAVYTGDCGTLQMMVCNDDHQGLSAQVDLTISSSVPVLAGETYYVEVADWQENPPASGEATLSLAALITPFDSRWKPVVVAGTPALSRHASVVSGNSIYVIGGQSTLAPTGASTVLYRFDTSTAKWSQPTAMAGPPYFFTTAALVDGRIYVPSGDAGNSNAFAGTHWVYDIAGAFWDQAVDNAWPGDNPIAYSAAVAADSGYYVSGGLSVNQLDTATFIVHPDVFFYSPASGWSTRPSLNYARFSHMSALVPGLGVCVTGGKDQSIVNSTECLIGGSWQELPNAALNVGRHGAGSAIGPDGNWYVFGGTGGDDNTIPFVEVFDPDAGVWRLLDGTYELGGFDGLSVRTWPRGHFVGNTLWAIGGNTNDNQVLRQVVKLQGLYFPSSNNDVQLPFVATGYLGNGLMDGTFATARLLRLNQAKSQDFNVSLDLYDIFYFELSPASGRTTVKVRLLNIPVGNNYELSVFDDNKGLLATTGVGGFDGDQSKSLSLSLEGGRYYVMVHRIVGPPRPGNYYQVKVEVIK